jgi:hypothetical protein
MNLTNPNLIFILNMSYLLDFKPFILAYLAEINMCVCGTLRWQ